MAASTQFIMLMIDDLILIVLAVISFKTHVVKEPYSHGKGNEWLLRFKLRIEIILYPDVLLAFFFAASWIIAPPQYHISKVFINFRNLRRLLV